MQLGIIGLGRMGGDIARRLLADGHRCVVHDLNLTAVDGLAIAMGQVPDVVKASADSVTRSNADDGFFWAVEQLILPRFRARLGG